MYILCLLFVYLSLCYSLQYEKLEKERKAEQALKNYQALIDAEDAEVVTNKEEFDCLICYVPTEPGEGVILRECLHQFCKYDFNSKR